MDIARLNSKSRDSSDRQSHPRAVGLLFLCFITIFSSVALAQVSKPLQSIEEAEHSVRVWQTRVDDISKEIVSESSAVPDSERSLYLALVAKMWWKVDESQAREYLKKASDKLLSSIQSDDKTDRAKKFKFIQKALQVITGLDEKLGLSLMGKIEESTGDDDDNRKEDADIADMFAKLGLQIVQTNPQMALAFGMDSLNYGRSRDLPRLVFEIHAKDKLLGEGLLRRALLMARGVFSIENAGFVGDIGNYIFDQRPGRIVSDTLRRSYLELYAELVAGAAEIESERAKRCTIAFFAPTILPRIDEYLPALAPTVRQHVQICVASMPKGSQEYTRDKLANEGPKIAE